jgi:hypothetical protein
VLHPKSPTAAKLKLLAWTNLSRLKKEINKIEIKTARWKNEY